MPDYVTEQREGQLLEVWRRLITDPKLDLRLQIATRQIDSPSAFIAWCQKNNIVGQDAVEAYMLVVEGRQGSYRPQQMNEGPEPHPRRVRPTGIVSYVMHDIQSHALAKTELKTKADRWDRAVRDSEKRNLVDSKGRKLTDLKSYSEFLEFQKETNVSKDLWADRQYKPVHEWEMLTDKYPNNGLSRYATDEERAEWRKDLRNVGLGSIRSPEELEEWKKVNKVTDLPENVFELRNQYMKHHHAKQWEFMMSMYPVKKPKPWQRNDPNFEKNPLNKGLENLKTEEEYKAVVNHFNQGKDPEKEKESMLTMDELLGYRSAYTLWHNLALAEELEKEQDEIDNLIKEAEAKKVAAEKIELNAPVTVYGGMTAPQGRKPYIPPPANAFNDRRSGETSPKINQSQMPGYGGLTLPQEETRVQEESTEEVDEQAFDEGTAAPHLERVSLVTSTSIPPAVMFSSGANDDFSDQDPSRPQQQERRSTGNSGMSGRSHLNKVRALNNALRGGRSAGMIARAAPAIWSALPWIIAGIVILIIIIVVYMIVTGAGGGSSNKDDIPLNFTKSGPIESPNNTEITYNLSASYLGYADNLIITDKLPEGVEVVDEKTTKPYQYDAATRVVTWKVDQVASSSATTTASAASIDATRYTQAPYSFPSPNGNSDISYTGATGQNLNELGSYVAKHQSYLVTNVKNNDPQYVDPFLTVIWNGAIEGTGGNQFTWNCLDNQNIKINDGCKGGYYSGGWQVGYGIQVAEAVTQLEADFNEVYGPGSANDASKVASVGQRVITQSASVSQITNPKTFPNETISSLVAKAAGGAEDAQQAIAILLMDKELGAVAISQRIAANISGQDNWRATMEGWGQYYRSNMQTFANRIPELAKIYTGASGGGNYLGSRSVTLTLRPTQENFYVTNISNAQVIGARGKGPGAGGTIDVASKSLEEIIRGSAANANIPYELLKALMKRETGGLPFEYSEEEVQLFTKPNWWANLANDMPTLAQNDPLIRRGFAYNTCQYRTDCGPGSDVRGAMQFEINTWATVANRLQFSDNHEARRENLRDVIYGAGLHIQDKTKVDPSRFSNITGPASWTGKNVMAIARIYCGGNASPDAVNSSACGGIEVDKNTGYIADSYDVAVCNFFYEYKGQNPGDNCLRRPGQE